MKKSKWVSTDCDWKFKQKGIEVKRKIPVLSSYLRQIQIANSNKPFTWDQINKMFEVRTGLTLDKILMTRAGCSYGAFNSACDVCDFYRTGKWYGFKNGSDSHKIMTHHYDYEMQTRGEQPVIDELFDDIKKFVHSVPMKTIKDNLDKQKARNKRSHTQEGTGKKAFNENITLKRTASDDYNKFRRNPK